MQTSAQHADVPRTPRKPSETEVTIVVGFRLPALLVDALDEEAEQMAPPGIRFSRTDAVRILLTEAIAARKASRKKR